ncbi:YHYH domain-containing protein [Corallococcus sp. RDP092CA]|uniref:YHYH domain-containing protein n=1 Tax=Corallococcus sp. RDP092CA TaxID=3109369 RepID=UPI0035AE23F2
MRQSTRRPGPRPSAGAGGAMRPSRKVALGPGVFAGLACSHLAWAHPGRTNSAGCHNERATGGYHCRGGGLPEGGTSTSENGQTSRAHHGTFPPWTAWIPPPATAR